MTGMPVLDSMIDSAAKAEDFSGKDVVVLHINHCMENSFYFSEAMKRIFFEVVFVGVPYNDREVSEGYTFPYYYGKNRRGTYELYQGRECFLVTDRDFTEATELLLERAVRRDIIPLLEQGKQLLVIEDGGYHYRVLLRLAKEYPLLFKQMRGSVEQTSSGTVKCFCSGMEYGFFYPCTSISRSHIKMDVESRFIGHRVVEELSGFLYTANTFLDFHHVLLLGYGIVGRRVAQDLRGKKCRVTVYDPDVLIAGIARAEGYDTVEAVTEDCFLKNTIVIGNVGADAFPEEMLRAFLEAPAQLLYLASSSSQDREFKTFLNMAEGKRPFPEGAVLESLREEEFYTVYRLRWKGREKRVFLIAQGMPVNFYRKDVISLTYSIIDLVFSEMLSMGITLCQRQDLEPRLYLLGEDDGFMPYISEEKLTQRWFSCYDLWEGESLKAVLDSHPGSDHLRKKLVQRASTKAPF